jgi:peptidoglycan hydrolase-like protein with peptidoglycan-binding domain
MKAIDKKILIGSAIAVVVIIIVVIVIFYYKKKKEKEQNNDNNTKKENNSLHNNKPVDKPKTDADPLKDLSTGKLPLKLGDKNKITGILQMALNYLHNARLNVTGEFSSTTEATVKNYYNTTIVDGALAQQIYNDLQKAKADESFNSLFYKAFIKK